MKKIITLCILSILSLPIYSNTTNKNLTLEANKDNVKAEKEVKVVEPEKKIKNKFIRIKGLYGMPGEISGYKYGEDGKVKLSDIDAGIEGMVEGVYRINKSAEIAMGLGFQGLGYLDTNGVVAENNYAIPLYISVKYNLFKSPIYLKGAIGVTWNIGTDDLKTFVANQENGSLGLTKDSINLQNGLYGAAGVGIDIWKFEIEGLYSVNQIVANYVNPVDSKQYTREVENHRISVGASYAFDWK